MEVQARHRGSQRCQGTAVRLAGDVGEVGLAGGPGMGH